MEVNRTLFFLAGIAICNSGVVDAIQMDAAHQFEIDREPEYYFLDAPGPAVVEDPQDEDQEEAEHLAPDDLKGLLRVVKSFLDANISDDDPKIGMVSEKLYRFAFLACRPVPNEGGNVNVHNRRNVILEQIILYHENGFDVNIVGPFPGDEELSEMYEQPLLQFVLERLACSAHCVFDRFHTDIDHNIMSDQIIRIMRVLLENNANPDVSIRSIFGSRIVSDPFLGNRRGDSGGVIADATSVLWQNYRVCDLLLDFGADISIDPWFSDGAWQEHSYFGMGDKIQRMLTQALRDINKAKLEAESLRWFHAFCDKESDLWKLVKEMTQRSKYPGARITWREIYMEDRKKSKNPHRAEDAALESSSLEVQYISGSADSIVSVD